MSSWQQPVLLAALASVVAGCGAPNRAPAVTNTAPEPPRPARVHVTEVGTGMADSDFDGDHRPDPIHADFSGGGHCCYTLSIALSTLGASRAFPFELDGGYPFGLDLSQPERFYIADYTGDGVADICAEIQTYNGEPSALPDAWRRDYGITSNWIVLSFTGPGAGVHDRDARTCDAKRTGGS